MFYQLSKHLHDPLSFRGLIYTALGFSEGSGAYTTLYHAGALDVNNLLHEASEMRTPDESEP